MKPAMIARWTGCMARALAAALLLATPAHESVSAGETTASLHGNVWYRERILPPPGAEVVVTLEHAGPDGRGAAVLARTRLPAEGSPPYPFVLEYDPARLREDGEYLLRARIEAQGRALFTSRRRVPAFRAGAHAPVEILVARAQDGPASPGAALTGRLWELVALGETAATAGPDGRPPHLVLGEAGLVHGDAGCNRFQGGYQEDGEALGFGPLAATMMACQQGMEQEQRFLRALESTRRYALEGDVLTLLDDDGEPLARLRAKPAP